MDLKNKNVLVTGGSGFIGGAFCKKLKEEKIKFYNFSRSNNIDITNWEKIKDTEDVDAIYHFAALNPSIDYSIKHPHETYHTTLTGTLNMLELARVKDIKKFIFLSSAAVYGPPNYDPVDEKHPLNGNNPYAYSKILAEDLCKNYNQNYNISVIILRLFNIYGKGHRENLLIPTILKQLNNSNEIELKNSKSKRDFLHIDDLVTLLLSLMNKNLNGFNVFNVGSGEAYSVEELIAKIGKIKNQKINVKYREIYDGVLKITADITKAKELLGWQPKISLEEGLERTLKPT